MHSPKNFLPTAATQMNFATRELNVIGHWSSNSRMNERYDRSVCANELLLRNTIIQKVVQGWNMVESFRLPETVPGSGRIGKDACASQLSAVEPFRPPVIAPSEKDSNSSSDTTGSGVFDKTAPAVAVTQDPPASLPDQSNVVIDDTLSGSLPVLPEI